MHIWKWIFVHIWFCKFFHTIHIFKIVHVFFFSNMLYFCLHISTYLGLLCMYCTCLTCKFVHISYIFGILYCCTFLHIFAYFNLHVTAYLYLKPKIAVWGISGDKGWITLSLGPLFFSSIYNNSRKNNGQGFSGTFAPSLLTNEVSKGAAGGVQML